MKRGNLALRETESWRPPALRDPNLGCRMATRSWHPLPAHEAGAVRDVGCGEEPYRCRSFRRPPATRAWSIFADLDPDESFDLIAAFDVLEQIADEAAVRPQYEDG